MILILGLGNPGQKYTATPHNLGFRVADAALGVLGAPSLTPAPRFAADVSRVKRDRRTLIIAKPTTLMNRSGDAAQKLRSFHRIALGDLWVIHDDLDLPPGMVRHSFDSRAAGHRGVQSIIDALGSQAFHRIRIGIGRDPRLDAEAYVLRRMAEPLRTATDAAIPVAVNTLLALLDHELETRPRHYQPKSGPLGE